VLCEADGKRLGAELQNWGSYYDTRPAITAINVMQSRQALLHQPLLRKILHNFSKQAKQLALLIVDGCVCN
jgi:hypothetical protein